MLREQQEKSKGVFADERKAGAAAILVPIWTRNAFCRGQEEININNVCASFQKEAVDQLVDKSIYLLEKEKLNKIVISGGVSANKLLREEMTKRAERINAKVYYPELILCTDNAAMIGSAGYYNYVAGKNIVNPVDLHAECQISL